MVVHVYNPSTWRLRQTDPKFKSSLRALRAPWATHQDPDTTQSPNQEYRCEVLHHAKAVT